MTKICDFRHPIYDLTKNSIPYLWPLWGFLKDFSVDGVIELSLQSSRPTFEFHARATKSKLASEAIRREESGAEAPRTWTSYYTGVGFWEHSCPKQGQDFKPSAATLGLALPLPGWIKKHPEFHLPEEPCCYSARVFITLHLDVPVLNRWPTLTKPILHRCSFLFHGTLKDNKTGVDLGGGCRRCTPPPHRNDMRLSDKTGILKIKRNHVVYWRWSKTWCIPS